MTVRAEAVVDLDAVTHNIARVRAATASTLMAVVKADAYGHGIGPIAAHLRTLDVDWLGVALPEEALALRAGGDTGRILAWLTVPGSPATTACIGAGVDLGCGSAWLLREIAAAARAEGRRARVHLKVDTGLGRGGAVPAEWADLLAEATASADAVEVVAVWSHLASAEDLADPSAEAQARAFADALAEARAAGLDAPIAHLGNSAAALARPGLHFDMVRVGIAVYGLTPGRALGTAAELGLRPAMTLRARVAHVKRVPGGHGVSYGLTWRAPRETTLALVPLGYADGIPRSARGAHVLIGGLVLPVVGRVAMDQVVVDAGDAGVSAGDDVVVFGTGAAGEPTADDWGEWSGSIGYEITTRIGVRVPRRYVGGAR